MHVPYDTPATTTETAAYLSDFGNTLSRDFAQMEKKKSAHATQQAEEKKEKKRETQRNQCLPLENPHSTFLNAHNLAAKRHIFNASHTPKVTQRETQTDCITF